MCACVRIYYICEIINTFMLYIVVQYVCVIMCARVVSLSLVLFSYYPLDGLMLEHVRTCWNTEKWSKKFHTNFHGQGLEGF